MRRTNSWLLIFLSAAVVAAIAAYSFRTRLLRVPEPDAFATRAGPPDIYPNPMHTPGAINPEITDENIQQTICNPGWSTKLVRPPARYTTKLKIEQLGEYDYADINPSDYEEDHLIPLELGGNPTDPRNLWPELYKTSIPDGGARAKDQVENYLHKQVCAGTIPLQTAQREIATDWYRIYVTSVKKSF
jgi:hypothetical protein